MNNFSYDFLVFIGRFQPFHQGHLQVIKQGLMQAGYVIVLIGSAHQARSIRNPWRVAEREQMLRGALSTAESQRVLIAPLNDMMYNDEVWMRNVQTAVQTLVARYREHTAHPPSISLLGHSKDETSYYLNLFPQWGAVTVSNYQNIDATTVRTAYWEMGTNHHYRDNIDQWVPANVAVWLEKFAQSAEFQVLSDELSVVREYKQSWEKAPYVPIFVTVDAVVVQSGHVLLVERQSTLGKGRWALPGGFVNSDETLVNACLRELIEETQLQISTVKLRSAIQKQDVFDDPHRSVRGRTITHAFYIVLKADSQLPKVKGGDDARDAFWVPLAGLEPSKLFDDHYYIIQKMVGVL